jgi:hypothetical protein
MAPADAVVAPVKAAPTQSPLVGLTAEGAMSQPMTPALPALSGDPVRAMTVPLNAGPPTHVTLPGIEIGPVVPRLTSMVEPAVPQQVLDELPGDVEWQIDLDLRADGSVARVLPGPSVPRAFQRYIIAALQQWRFDPLPASQSHRIVLVFRKG